LATVGVNIISTILFLLLLDRKLNKLPLQQWSLPILSLTAASFLAGLASWSILWGCQHLWGSKGLLLQLLQLSLSGIVGLGVFAAIAAQMKLPEVELFMSRLRQRFIKGARN
jgi:putative peptidoglycan lipid II flippase